jgi:hypothetical protein
MSTARVTTHTASPGDSATTRPAGVLPLATAPSCAKSRNVANRPGSAVAVIARLPDVSTAAGSAAATTADGKARSPGEADSSHPVSIAKQRLQQRWTAITARWRQRAPWPRDGRRMAIIGGAVACGLGLVAIAILVAPRLGRESTDSGANQRPIANSSWKTFSVDTPMLPPAGPSNALLGDVTDLSRGDGPLWTPPSESTAGTYDISSENNSLASTQPLLFPNLPDPATTSSVTNTSDTSGSGTSRPQLAPPAGSQPAVVVSNQPDQLTPPATPQSSGSEVFIWRKNEMATPSPPDTQALTQPSAASGLRAFRAPQAMDADVVSPERRAGDTIAHHAPRPNTPRPNTIVTDRYRSGYHAPPMPDANVTAPQGLMPEDTVPMAQNFPTTQVDWWNDRLRRVTGNGRRGPAAQPPAAPAPYQGYAPGTAPPYVVGPSSTPPGSVSTSAIPGRGAYIGQQPQTQSRLR